MEFVDVAERRNLRFVGHYGPSFAGATLLGDIMQRNMGNGAAVGDYDGDGDLDVYLLGQLGRRNRLYRNELDRGRLGFADVTAAAGVGDTGMSRVAHFADLDNDGDLDLLLVNDDDGSGAYPPSRVFRNEGRGHFTDVSAGSGFTPLGHVHGGASLADFDRDGLLDVYVSNWSFEVGGGTPGFPGSNRLYRNLGDLRFADVTESAGLGGLSRDSFSTIFHDFDGDGFPDLYVAVDHTSDEFYWNRGGTFVPGTDGVGATHTGNDMGLACADFDDDGDVDLYATNITDPAGVFGTTQFNVLNVNQHSSTQGTQFLDGAVSRGVQDSYWGWGTAFSDLDNDGDLDIVAVNGFDELVGYVSGGTSPLLGTPDVVFENDGRGSFVRRTDVLGGPADSRALIAFDYDRDGDEDLLITEVDGPVRLLENRGPPRARWLGVRLVQARGSNRNGIGATVHVTAGGVTRRREVLRGGSFLAGTPAEVLFGLGSTQRIDEVRVDWTDGSTSVLPRVRSNRWLTIRQRGGVALPRPEDTGYFERKLR